MSSKPFFHCSRLGHSLKEFCPNDGMITCTKCFRVNVFSTGCNCSDRIQPDPPQILRQIGRPKAHKWYTDVSVHDRLFPAMINTSITRCQVSTTFADWWESVNIISTDQPPSLTIIEIQRKGRRLRITCDILRDFEDDVHIHLGTELMTFLGYTYL
ncbi:hypothetical protein ACFFRR_009791 [Megaselia abdita]